jgi:hypothetical protein
MLFVRMKSPLNLTMLVLTNEIRAKIERAEFHGFRIEVNP